jgi:UDP-N-acetylmuramoyl-L-alanyl-D-glutamate--2,6-diaminopimelate ligase
MRFWGITGTNGKTTTAWILAEFFRADPKRKCALITTVETDTLKRKLYTGYTTPPLATLKELYAEMEANGATDCVMEVSSHAIHQRRTGDTVFAGGAFTNLSEDHLDYHKTMEEYFRVKFSFAEQIAAERWHGEMPAPELGRRDFPPYVVCLDGDNGERMFNKVGNLPLNAIPVSLKSQRFDLSGLKLVGDYNKLNVLTAAALAEAAGVDHDAIQRVIPTLTPRWGRLEKVDSSSAADVYVDFAHTPDGLEKVLTAARGFTRGKLWVVFGAGGDRDRTKRPLMGAAAARIADKIVITSDNPRSEEPAAIIAEIMTGVNAPADAVIIESDRKLAIHQALSRASAGDVILICGKGHETTQEIAGVKYPFDDREVVLNFR